MAWAAAESLGRGLLGAMSCPHSCAPYKQLGGYEQLHVGFTVACGRLHPAYMRGSEFGRQVGDPRIVMGFTVVCGRLHPAYMRGSELGRQVIDPTSSWSSCSQCMR